MARVVTPIARVATPIVIALKKQTGPGAAPPAAQGASLGSPAGVSHSKDINGAYDSLPAAEDVVSPPSPPPSSPSRGRGRSPGKGSEVAPPSPASLSVASGDAKPLGLDPESVKGVLDDADVSATPWCPSFAATPSLLDVVTLADMFRVFHSDVEAWVKEESEKLFEQESKIQGASRSLRERSALIQGFLKEFTPDGLLVEANSDEDVDQGEDAENVAENEQKDGELDHRRRKRRGADDDSEADVASGSEAENTTERKKDGHEKTRAKRGSGKSKEPKDERSIFAKSALPQLLEVIADDQLALQDAGGLLEAFVQRYFPSNKELAQLSGTGAPVALFRAMLRVIISALGVSQPKDKKTGGTKRGGDRDRRGADERGVKRGRSRDRVDGRANSHDDASQDSLGGGNGRDGQTGGREGRADRDGRYERDGRGGRDHRGEKSRGGRSRSRDGGKKTGRDGGGRSRSGGRGRERRGDERGRRR